MYKENLKKKEKADFNFFQNQLFGYLLPYHVYMPYFHMVSV